MKLLKSISIYYDNVNIIAQPNNQIFSRKQIKKDISRIFVSPMPSVVGKKFAEEALSLGLSVCLHRFCKTEEQVELYYKLSEKFGNQNIWCAIGLNDERETLLLGAGCNNFIIDVANGYLSSVVDYTEYLINQYPIINLMAGNIHSANGVNLYNKFGKNRIYLRCGIANGSGCDTKKMTAVNRGQITELSECCPLNNKIIADGGISSPEMAVKAFGCGVNYIMMGGYFSKAEEAQNVVDNKYKFWGCASTYQQNQYGGKRNHSEGKEIEINQNEIKPLKVLVDDLWGGISSGISYSGYNSLESFIGNAVFEMIYK